MYRKMVGLGVIVALALTMIAAAQAGSSGSIPVSAAPVWAPPVQFTDVIPFFPRGALGSQASGECWTSSNVLPRANAWRCMIGNDIYDPCFSSSSSADWVACDVNPLSDGLGGGLRVNLTAPLAPDIWTSDTIYPWYMELADGTTCYSLGRDTFPVDDDWANYACAGADFILGEPEDDGSGIWYANRARLSSDGSAAHSAWEPVRIVWY